MAEVTVPFSEASSCEQYITQHALDLLSKLDGTISKAFLDKSFEQLGGGGGGDPASSGTIFTYSCYSAAVGPKHFLSGGSLDLLQQLTAAPH